MNKPTFLKGFTLIEILVVISIMGILMATTMFFYGRTGEQQIVLFREQTKILNILSRAKFLSIQTFGQKEERVPCGYGVYFEEPQTVILFKDEAENCSNADRKYSGEDEEVEKISLDKAIVFEPLFFSDIVFIPPNPTVIITPRQEQVTIILKIRDSSNRVAIKVNDFGQVSTQ